MKLNVKAFGLAIGIVWSVGMFLIAMMAALFNWGNEFVKIFSSMYIGYQATFLGSIIGAIWGFVDAGIGGILFAWLYNKLAN